MSFRRLRGQHPGEPSPRTRKPSSAERRKAARAASAEDIGFAFGFFFLAMPFPAIVIAFVGVLTGIVTLLEALVSVGVTSGWVGLEVFDNRGARVIRSLTGAV